MAHAAQTSGSLLRPIIHGLRGFIGAPQLFGGAGQCHPHLGEFLQGAIEVEKYGRPGIERCLVSVHMPHEPGSTARFTLDPRRTGITVIPKHFTKCRRAARLMLDALGHDEVGGVLEVTTHVPEGGGMGSSTTGVVATLRAVADAAGAYSGTRIPPASRLLVAKLTVAAERAADPLMFDCCGTTLLFAHRTGTVLKTFGGPLPRMIILGFDTATAGGVDTDALPRARYSPEQIAAFGCAVATLERAISEQSVDLVGRVATFSATVNQPHLPKPNFEQLLAIKDRVGAAGLAVAHSGTVAGLIFDPALADLTLRMAKARALVACLGFGRLREFSTPY